MGIYNTIPAYNINATYNVITQTLTLTALGEVGKSTTGFGFKMMTLSKGLNPHCSYVGRNVLECWVSGFSGISLCTTDFLFPKGL